MLVRFLVRGKKLLVIDSRVFRLLLRMRLLFISMLCIRGSLALFDITT